MSVGLYSGVSGLALGTGLYKNVSGLWGGAAGLIDGFGGGSPFGGASLYLNFLAGAPLDSRITFTRGTNATLVDSTGKITYAPNNLLLQSQTFESGSWIKLAATIAADTTVAPDGTSTADTIEAPVGGAGAPRVYQRPAITGTTTYTISSYFKASGTNFAFLSMRTSGANWTGAEFDLSTGTVTRNAITGNVAYVGATISDAGNGWYRCTVTVTPTDTIAAGVGFIFFGPSDGTSPFVGGFPTFTNTGTETVFIWGAQLEQVTYQTVPSTYNATTTAAYYGPRFDYDPVTLAPKGLLIEEQRTNLLLQSEAFGTTWTGFVATVSSNAAVSPDGTTDADKIIPDNAATLGSSGVTQTVTAAAATYTYSVYAKIGEYNRVRLLVRDSASAVNNASVIVSLVDGTITTAAAAAGTFTDASATVTAAGNGFYRVSLTLTSTGASSLLVRAFVDDSVATTGNGTSGIFLWGAQLEAGSFATSYIPTVASQVTRSTDVATMTGTNFSSWYNQSEGTFVADFDVLGFVANQRVFEAGDGTGANFIGWYSASGSHRLRVTNAGGTTSAIGLNTLPAAGVIYKEALAFQTGNCAISVDGATVATLGSTIPTGLNKLNIGSSTPTDGNQLNGHIRQIAYFNTRLSNAQLQELTAPPLVTTLSLDFTNGIYDA